MNVISHFISPKLRVEVIHGLRPIFYLMRSSCCFCFGKFLLHLFLDTGQKLRSFSANMLVAMQLGKDARLLLLLLLFLG